MTYSNDTKFQDSIWTTATSGTSGPTKSKPANSLFTTGFLYGVSAPPPEAPNQNWLQNRSDSFCALIEKYGSISYLTGVDYDVGATVYNDNNGTISLYKCNIPNGPSTATVNPVGDASGTWTRINQWSSKGYTPNTAIVSDANGDIQASNLNENYWYPDISYKFGQKVITRGLRADGEEYRIVWVNVKTGGDNIGIDPEGSNGSNLDNTNFKNATNTGQYDWFNENWRQERAEIYLSGFTTQENHFVSILGYITPKGSIVEAKGDMKDSVISVPPSPTYVEFKNLTDQYGYSLSNVLINGDSVFSTNTLVQNQVDRDENWNIEPVHYGTLPALFWVWSDGGVDNKKTFAFANNLTDTTAGARAKFIMQEFYITDKIRNV